MSVQFNTERLAKHKELSDSIKSGLVVEETTIKETESHSAYNANLPEGIDAKTVKTLARYNNDFVAATHIAVAETAAEVFNKNKDIDRLSAQVGFFGKHDKININADRSKTYQNQQAKNEEDKLIEKHLVLSGSVQTSGYGLKGVRRAISDEFADRFVK